MPDLIEEEAVDDIPEPTVQEQKSDFLLCARFTIAPGTKFAVMRSDDHKFPTGSTFTIKEVTTKTFLFEKNMSLHHHKLLENLEDGSWHMIKLVR